jgi:hypothetical protein
MILRSYNCYKHSFSPKLIWGCFETLPVFNKVHDFWCWRFQKSLSWGTGIISMRCLRPLYLDLSWTTWFWISFTPWRKWFIMVLRALLYYKWLCGSHILCGSTNHRIDVLSLRCVRIICLGYLYRTIVWWFSRNLTSWGVATQRAPLLCQPLLASWRSSLVWRLQTLSGIPPGWASAAIRFPNTILAEFPSHLCAPNNHLLPLFKVLDHLFLLEDYLL